MLCHVSIQTFLLSIWARTLTHTLWWRFKNCAPWSQTPPKGSPRHSSGALAAHRKTEAACCPHPDTFWYCHGCDKPQNPSPVWSDHDRPDLCLTALPTGRLTDWLTAHPPSETYFTFVYLHQYTPTFGITACRNARCVPALMLLCFFLFSTLDFMQISYRLPLHDRHGNIYKCTITK